MICFDTFRSIDACIEGRLASELRCILVLVREKSKYGEVGIRENKKLPTHNELRAFEPEN
jgi:hypothetical protein